MIEYDLMKLVGHVKFETSHKYYLAVRDDLIDRARLATDRGLCKKLIGFGAPAFGADKTRRNKSVDKQKRELRMKLRLCIIPSLLLKCVLFLRGHYGE